MLSSLAIVWAIMSVLTVEINVFAVNALDDNPEYTELFETYPWLMSIAIAIYCLLWPIYYSVLIYHVWRKLKND